MHQGLHFYHLLHDQDELLTLLKENGIPTVRPRRCTIRTPEMRSMGDVGFSGAQRKGRADYELLLANGYELFEEKGRGRQAYFLPKGRGTL